MDIAFVTGASFGMGKEFVSHRFVMNTWLKQQKKAKNNKGLA